MLVYRDDTSWVTKTFSGKLETLCIFRSTVCNYKYVIAYGRISIRIGK